MRSRILSAAEHILQDPPAGAKFLDSTSLIQGWISGRASDFDGDGCEDRTLPNLLNRDGCPPKQDGVEDQDRDNDGVEDKMDRPEG